MDVNEELERKEPEGARPWRRLPIVVIALAAVAGAVLLRDQLTVEALGAHRDELVAFRDAHFGVSALLFVTLYAVIVALSLPGATMMTLMGGFLFNLFPGFLMNAVGATLGATALFAAARAGLGPWLAERMDARGGQAARVMAAIRRNEWSVLFLIRLVPAVPFFLANLLPALVGVALGRFVVTTFLGILPGCIVYTSVGAGLGSLIDRGAEPNLAIIFEPRFLLPILGLCLLAALPMAFRHLMHKDDAEHDDPTR